MHGVVCAPKMQTEWNCMHRISCNIDYMQPQCFHALESLYGTGILPMHVIDFSLPSCTGKPNQPKTPNMLRS